MAEIVLSIKNDSGNDPVCMAKETVESIFTNIFENKRLLLTLHGDWAHPPVYSEWLFNTIKDRRIQTKLCTDSIESLDSIKHLLSDQIHIELSLLKDDPIPPQTGWSEISNISFFLPIDTPSPDGSLYDHILDQIPEKRKVILGINWKDRLSGPAPTPADDYSIWSDTVIALVDKLSQKKIKAEFACGLKLCMFSRDQLGHLPKKLLVWPIAYCARSFFYTLEGNLQPCMRLTLPEGMSLSSDSNLQKAAEVLEKWLLPYGGSCYETDDFDCLCLKAGSCETGCLQHSIGEWQSS